MCLLSTLNRRTFALINTSSVLAQIQRCWFRRRQLLSLLLVALLSSSCQLIENLAPPAVGNAHLMLGNPSHAVTLNGERYHLFLRPQYALLYDRTTNTPAWASWQLNASWLGNLSRPVFTPDPMLPAGWFTVTPRNYTGSGFDRGHMVPAADRNRTPEDSAAVFYMTNIAPQAPDNNRGPWEGLESYCRTLVRSGKELYIIAGPAGKGGVGSAGPQKAISANQITVPAAFWKIVVVINRPGLGLDSITSNTRIIAVSIPNQQGIKEEKWQKFRTTVHQLEQRTGYDFLSNLPIAVQDALENQAD
jgi:endonuclease G, mitochondrial